MRNLTYKSIIVLLLAAILPLTSLADVRLPAVIGSNMVLQQKTDAPLWGWADPGEKVYVKASWLSLLGNNKAKTTADQNGKWQISLKTPKAGGPYKIIIKGDNTIELDNVMTGEVWICSGQSNMAFSLRSANNAEQEIAAANCPNIRLMQVTRHAVESPQDDCQGQWNTCTPETVSGFSAVAYFFGRELYQNLNIPIGLIHTSWGGTRCEAWTSIEALQSEPEAKPILDRYAQAVIDLPEATKKYEADYAEWKQKADKLKAEGKNLPRAPYPPIGPNHRHGPANLYNGMIAPLTPYAIKGAIWYQGEGNAGRAYQYRTIFPNMIKDWRSRWHCGSFPFYFVQIAPYRYSTECICAELREAQMMTLSLENTGMAVTMDIGNPKDIHPRNKQDVGKRLALWALAQDYGQNKITYSGPIYKSMKVEADKIRLSFDYVDGGLKAGPDGLANFTIAGADKKFVTAQAIIAPVLKTGKEDALIVFSEDVPNPVAVRYCWDNIMEGTLFNKADLPASSFRTDDWPGVTANER